KKPDPAPGHPGSAWRCRASPEEGPWSSSVPVNVFAGVVSVFDRDVDVAFIDDDRWDQDGRNVFLPVVDLVPRLDRLLARELDRGVDGTEGQGLDRFVNRHRLSALHDSLHGVLLRVLSGDQNFSGQPCRVERGNGTAGGAVVRSDDRVDLVAG